MAAVCLSLREREEIRVGIERGDTDSQIGESIGRHRCTINAEINRNGGRSTYCAAAADSQAIQNRRRDRGSKLVDDPVLVAHVLERLEKRDSPMTISIELARGVWGITRSVCHETIYQAIYSGVFGKVRTPHLDRRRRKSRKQRRVNSHSLGEFKLIRDRPEAADRRDCVGHFEGDLIVGANNQSALITLVDRKSRKCWIGKVASKKAVDLTVGLTKLLDRVPEIVRGTLAWDQGSEIAQWRSIEKRCGIDVFIAEAQAPWQRPSNENLNAHVRRYVGKGTDLNAFDQDELDAIAHRLNTTPRRSLGWATANDIYNQHVAITD